MREAVRYDQDYAEPNAGLVLKTAADEKRAVGSESAAGSASGVVKLVYAAGEAPADDNEWHPLAGPAPTD